MALDSPQGTTGPAVLAPSGSAGAAVGGPSGASTGRKWKTKVGPMLPKIKTKKTNVVLPMRQLFRMTYLALFLYKTTPTRSSPEPKLLGSGKYLVNKSMLSSHQMLASFPDSATCTALHVSPVPTGSTSTGSKICWVRWGRGRGRAEIASFLATPPDEVPKLTLTDVFITGEPPGVPRFLNKKA